MTIVETCQGYSISLYTRPWGLKAPKKFDETTTWVFPWCAMGNVSCIYKFWGGFDMKPRYHDTPKSCNPWLIIISSVHMNVIRMVMKEHPIQNQVVYVFRVHWIPRPHQIQFNVLWYNLWMSVKDPNNLLLTALDHDVQHKPSMWRSLLVML